VRGAALFVLSAGQAEMGFPAPALRQRVGRMVAVVVARARRTRTTGRAQRWRLSFGPVRAAAPVLAAVAAAR
jgi:hypothetical protein